MKFVSWNIDGASSVLRKCEFSSLLWMWQADIFSFQETKVLEPNIRLSFPGYYAYWSFFESCELPSLQSGTVCFCRREARNVFYRFPDAPEFDTEGRLIVLEYDYYYFINVYVPNSQDEVTRKQSKKSLERREYRAKFDTLLRKHVSALNEKKPVIICGDFNAALSKMDMSENSSWQDGEGFGKEANDRLKRLSAIGLTDTYRKIHPKEKDAYTHWHFSKNIRDEGTGRRLDYFFVSNDLSDLILDATIDANIKGSDHCPITLKIDLSHPYVREENLSRLTYEDLLQREESHLYYYSLLGSGSIGRTGTNVKNTIENSRYDLTRAWETVDWQRAEKHLQEMQCELAKVAYSRNPEVIRKIQFEIVRSLDAKLLAVRSVTSRKGEAGVDHIKWETPNEKMYAALSLTSKDYTAKPARAVDRKEKGKMRRICIDTYYDRAIQALYGYSLAPIMESWSDRTSFANRKGRTTMDANYYVCKVFSGTDAPEWLVKADVKKCYESISHEWIRENIPLADRVKNEFLRAGYFLSNKYVEKDQGIGIGCRLSPFLANMTMDGLQDYIYDRLFPGRGDNEVDWKDGYMVRFADDIIVSARKYETAVMIRQYIRDFMGERGLMLSDEKTQILHVKKGFDFLKRHYEKKGAYLIASPSKAAVTQFKNKITDFITGYKGSQEHLIEELNRKIVGFVSNHKMTDAWETFRELDAFIRLSLFRLCEEKYKSYDRKRIIKEFWYIDDRNRPTYAPKDIPYKKLLFMDDTIPTRYKPIPLHMNPYIDYEKIGQMTDDREIQNVVGIYRKIWDRQQGCCEYCRGKIYPDDEKELVEVDPTERSLVDRMAYIHARCRDAVIEEDYKEPEYPEEDQTAALMTELSTEISETEEETEENPLHQYFREAEKRTITLSFRQIENLYGRRFGELADHREFWVQKADDHLSKCWTDSDYFIKKISTEGRRYVTFRKYQFIGETGKVDLPDLLVHGEVPMRLKYKLETMIRHEFEQYGLPMY